VDAATAVEKPESDANLKLEPGDLVIFDETDPERVPEVNVMGEVSHPGAYTFTEGLSVLALLSQAGGPNDHAALTQAYVLRGITQLPLDLRPLLVEGKPDEAVTGFKLRGGDVLFLPEIKAHYSVMGEAAKPGVYVIPENSTVTVTQAVNLAGGGQTADLSRTQIVRSVDGKPTVITVNIPQMLKKHDFAQNVPLQPNDILYIPPKTRHGFGIGDILNPLFALRLLGFGL
jgi:protein involved in polysaccharide export with SLBB domain